MAVDDPRHSREFQMLKQSSSDVAEEEDVEECMLETERQRSGKSKRSFPKVNMPPVARAGVKFPPQWSGEVEARSKPSSSHNHMHSLPAESERKETTPPPNKHPTLPPPPLVPIPHSSPPPTSTAPSTFTTPSTPTPTATVAPVGYTLQVVPNVDLSSYLSMPLYTLLQATNQGSKGNAGSPTHILQKIQGIPILAGPPPGAAAVLRQVHVPSSQNPSSGAKREAGVLMVDCAGGAGVSGDGGGENDGDGARILSPSYVESPLLSLAAAAASTEESTDGTAMKFNVITSTDTSPK